jgi:hypothetical protein
VQRQDVVALDEAFASLVARLTEVEAARLTCQRPTSMEHCL